MEAAQRKKESVRKSSRPTTDTGAISRSFQKKNPVLAIVEDNQEAKPPRSKKSSSRQGYKTGNRQGKKPYPVLPSFPCDIKNL